jgi:hypothetical protein
VPCLAPPRRPDRSCAGAAEGELAQQAEALGAESVRQVAAARAEAEKTVQVWTTVTTVTTVMAVTTAARHYRGIPRPASPCPAPLADSALPYL